MPGVLPKPLTMTAQFMAAFSPTERPLRVNLCAVGTDDYAVMLVYANGFTHSRVSPTSTPNWISHDVPNGSVCRACSMDCNTSTEAWAGVVVYDSGIHIVHTPMNGESKYKHMFAAMSITCADIRACGDGFVLAFTVGRVIHVCTFAALPSNGGDFNKLDSKACTDVGTSQAKLVAAAIHIGGDHCYTGVTVADGFTANFLPWYELAPLEVFKVVHTTIAKLSQQTAAFTEALNTLQPEEEEEDEEEEEEEEDEEDEDGEKDKMYGGDDTASSARMPPSFVSHGLSVPASSLLLDLLRW